MEFLLRFFFILRLSFTHTTELFFVLSRLLIGSKTFLFSFVLSLMLVTTPLAAFVTKKPPVEPPIIYEKDRQAAETRISFWENIASSAPNRETFLNLEKLYTYLNEEDQANLFLKRAFILDPNNPEFANDSWLWEETTEATPSSTIN
jgi:hypothetical protein